MIHAQHRSSKDVDAFIDDPQYLGFLSPRLAAEEIWACETYEESANHLRLAFPEGEIDFIAAPKITSLPSQPKLIEVEEDGATLTLNIDIEHPVEIALNKLVYRNSMLKVRDMFDIAVVKRFFPTCCAPISITSLASRQHWSGGSMWYPISSSSWKSTSWTSPTSGAILRPHVVAASANSLRPFPMESRPLDRGVYILNFVVNY